MDNIVGRLTIGSTGGIPPHIGLVPAQQKRSGRTDWGKLGSQRLALYILRARRMIGDTVNRTVWRAHLAVP
jgi:hypothetical protein